MLGKFVLHLTELLLGCCMGRGSEPYLVAKLLEMFLERRQALPSQLYSGGRMSRSYRGQGCTRDGHLFARRLSLEQLITVFAGNPVSEILGPNPKSPLTGRARYFDVLFHDYVPKDLTNWRRWTQFYAIPLV